MRRATVVLTLAVLAASVLPTGAALASAPCRGWRFDADASGLGSRREQLRNRRVVRCTFGRVAPAQVDEAVAVARCESGLDDEAYNGDSGASGLFQHLRRYWPSRARALPSPPFGRRPSAFSSQANAWAAAKMVRASGWGAWSCSP